MRPCTAVVCCRVLRAALFAAFVVAALPAALLVAAESAPGEPLERIETIVREGLKKNVASYSVGILKDGRLLMARGIWLCRSGK